MKLYILICFIIVATEARSGGNQKGLTKEDVRYLRAYTGIDQSGASYEFSGYSSNLNLEGMNNIIVSYCGSGFWLFYDEPNYIGDAGATSAGLDQCENFDETYYNQTSSLRYAGSPFGLNDNYYNLYNVDYFRGLELKGNEDLNNLDSFNGTASLIISGQSAWTFFAGVSQTGAAVCVYPTVSDSLDGTVMNFASFPLISDLGLPGDSIRSLARGCLSDRIVGTPLSDLGEVHNA